MPRAHAVTAIDTTMPNADHKKMEPRIDKLDEFASDTKERLVRIETHVDGIDTRLEQIELRLDRLEGTMCTKEDLSNAVSLLATRIKLDAAIAQLATKVDLAAEIAPLATKAELAAAVAPLATKAELAAAIAPLATKADLAQLEATMLKYFIATLLSTGAIVIAAAKYLH